MIFKLKHKISLNFSNNSLVFFFFFGFPEGWQLGQKSYSRFRTRRKTLSDDFSREKISRKIFTAGELPRGMGISSRKNCLKIVSIHEDNLKIDALVKMLPLFCWLNSHLKMLCFFAYMYFFTARFCISFSRFFVRLLKTMVD